MEPKVQKWAYIASILGPVCAAALAQREFVLPGLARLGFLLGNVACGAVIAAAARPLIKRYRIDRGKHASPPPLPKEAGFISDRVLGLLALISFLIVAAIAFAGCAGGKVPTYIALEGMVQGARAARDLLPPACEVAQEKAIKAVPSAAAAAEQIRVMARCRAAKSSFDAVVDTCDSAGKEVHAITDLSQLPAAVARWAVAAANLYANAVKIAAELNIKMKTAQEIGGSK